MVYWIVLLFFSTSLSLSLCGSVDYYVTPTSPNTDCPQPCYTLDYYALNPSLLSNKENVSLLFFEGLHTLNHDLEISQMKRLRLIQVSEQVIVKCNSDIHFEHINQLEIINLTLRGNLVLTQYHPTVTLLKHTAHTALLQNLILDGFGMVLLGNSSLHSCKLNNTVVTMCSLDTPNIRSSLTLRKSKMTDSRIVNQGPFKNLKLVIIGCSIDTYLDRNSQDYQGTITFDVGPAKNLNVEIIDTWVVGHCCSQVNRKTITSVCTFIIVNLI